MVKTCKCGARVQDQAKYCPECGAEIEEKTLFCIKCGKQAPSRDAKFCPDCGAEYKPALSQPAQEPVQNTGKEQFVNTAATAGKVVLDGVIGAANAIGSHATYYLGGKRVGGGNITLTGDTFIFTGRNANVRIPYATISKATVGSRHNRFYLQTDKGQVHEFKVPASRCVWYIEKLNAAARISRQ